MIINAETLVPHLKEKVRLSRSDSSRHLICPHCKIRTRLNTLGDGRKNCTACGRKFRIHKVTKKNKLQQCAEILLCFCLDFSAHRTTQITHHRYRLVAAFYDHFRKLIANTSVPREKLPLLSVHKASVQVLQGKPRCKYCNSRIRPGDAEGKSPAFGVQFRDSGEVYIDPLKDEEAVLHFHTFGSHEEVPGRREGYAGMICCGKFHRFSKDEQSKESVEQVWTWIRERIRNHHGIWKKNTGLYLKELEWKYNHRALDPDVQARKIIELMPMDFLTSWSL